MNRLFEELREYAIERATAQEERERAAVINARMEADLLAEAYLHLEMRKRTRQDAEKAIRRSKVNAWPKQPKRTA